jgi:hypothetical protein
MTGKRISPLRQTWRENLTLKVQQHNIKFGYYVHKVLHRYPLLLRNMIHITEEYKQIWRRKSFYRSKQRIQTSEVQRQHGWIWCPIKFQLVKYNPQTVQQLNFNKNLIPINHTVWLYNCKVFYSDQRS